MLTSPRLSSYSSFLSNPDDFDLGDFDNLGGLRVFCHLASLKMSNMGELKVRVARSFKSRRSPIN